MNRNEEIKVSNKIISILKNEGIRIDRYYARTTKSIYLKLDYGVCGGVRISDHEGKYPYRYNVIKKYKGNKQYMDNGHLRLYYNYENTNDLINDIKIHKKRKLEMYGENNYKKYMNLNSNDKLYKDFKKVA